MNVFSLFTTGFILGLTGAMAPGPLLTITIGESAKRGGIVGPMVVLGHGILELLLLILIVFGLGNILHNKIIFSTIAFLGGFILIYMGGSTIKGLKHYQLSDTSAVRRQGPHPVISGIVVSLSNPYWLIWWITIGMGYVMFAGGLGVKGILAFFVGHILSDLLWYSFVSYSIQFGGRFFSMKVIKAILLACSIFLILFGGFFIARGYGFLSTLLSSR
jgi:threonine/homoserine/homoserine lactone efflux protein